MSTSTRLDDLHVTLHVDQAAAHRGLAVHIYGDQRPPAADVQVRQIAQLRSDGWAACVVVPMAPAWDEVAGASLDAGSRVMRTQARSTSATLLTIRTARLLRQRARWLVVNGFDAIHAHDDVAAAEWGMAARRSRIPMVWDIDLRTQRSLADLRRAACTSLVIAHGSGSRLDARWRLPPVRSAAGDHVGNWYYLAPDTHDLPAMANVATVADAYAMLTGSGPSLVPAQGLGPSRVVATP